MHIIVKYTSCQNDSNNREDMEYIFIFLIVRLLYHEIVFKRITHKFCIFCRVAFSWHPPVFFSSDLGHVTPPLSCACHVTVRLCCRQRGGCAGLCLG